MTAANPYPLANPLTDRPIGNVNWGQMARSGGFRSAQSIQADGQKLELPDSSMSYSDILLQQSELHVPQADDEPSMRMPLDMRSYGKAWNDREIMTLQHPQEIGLSPKDIKWKRRSDIENQKLSAEMSDFQKDMLAHVEDFVGQSKLIEENMHSIR